MNERMTASDWDQIFPNWPIRISEEHDDDAGSIFRRIEESPPMDVISAIFLYERWPGIIEPRDEMQEAIVFRAGRWCVTNDGIICLGEDYEIGSDQLGEDDGWFAHLLHKTWLYDPSDFLDTLEAARKHFLLDESVEQRGAAIAKQIQTALARHTFPFYPSRVLEKHVYLASHMDEQERLAFCEFLADRGFSVNR